MTPRQVLEEPVEHSQERIEFLARQKVEEVSLHILDVIRRRGFDGLSPDVGESNHQASTVVCAFLTDDQAPFRHSGELM
jgi:hypothetical protein